MADIAARPRRSVLYMPGSNARALEKAREIPADALILDLEDAVAPSEKRPARAKIVHALNGLDWGRTTRCVRRRRARACSRARTAARSRAARPSSIEKLEPPLFGSLIRPMLRIPRTCGTSVNSPGTVFFASSLHSALSGFWTELASTDCTCGSASAA